MLFGMIKKVDYKAMFLETVGSLLVAIGIYNFAVMSEFPMTGFSGIAIILYRLYSLPIGLTSILLNIPVALLCYRLLGKTFFLRSIRCIMISSFLIDTIAPMLPVYHGDRLLSAICTGIIGGIGYAMIYMQNSSTGGSDFITLSMKALNPHISLGKISFFAEVGIILLGGIIFQDMDGIIYGMIINYLFAIAVDKIMYGINAGKFTLIVTSMGDKITKVIEESSGRGSTIVSARGGFKKERKEVILCACNNKQMYRVQQAVKEADPDSFIIILESNEVHGEGFRPFSIGNHSK